MGSPSYYKHIDETLSLNSIAHREKKIQKFQIISEFENYSGAVNLWRNYTEEMLTKIVENESLDQEQIIETTIYRSLNVFMNKKVTVSSWSTYKLSLSE